MKKTVHSNNHNLSSSVFIGIIVLFSHLFPVLRGKTPEGCKWDFSFPFLSFMFMALRKNSSGKSSQREIEKLF